MLMPRFYLCNYMVSFETIKVGLSSKDKFYSSLTGHRISDKNFEHAVNVGKDLG